MAATSTLVSDSLFRLGLNEALPISDEATTSRVVVKGRWSSNNTSCSRFPSTKIGRAHV